MRRSVSGVSWLASSCVLAVWAGAAQAQPFPERELPPDLKPWAAWALDEVPDHVCPARGGIAVCLWPGRLALDLGAGGGSLRQEAYADREQYLPLPGSRQTWPSHVTLDGKAAIVVERGEAPAVRLTAGKHVVTGRFSWKQMPDSLAVPQATALVDLSVRGVRIPIPPREENGLLWLRRGSERGAAAESLRLQVFRKLSDGVPLFVDTTLILEVSGKAREVALSGGTLAHTQPIATQGDLPVQLQPDGQLRVQVRAGKFSISLLSRVEGRRDTIAVPKAQEPWPASEVWVFEADEQLRHAQVSGGTPIDPSRTDLPAEWRKLPAFTLSGGGALTVKELQRGEAEAPPDRVALARELWLDLDGRGLTARDQFSGTLSRTWRLDLLQPGELGHVTVGGADELITTAAGTDARGFEVRQSRLNAVAESRVPRRGFLSAALPAVGWDVDVEGLSARLNLAPGWSVLASTGVDQASGTWASEWTLLSFFLLLLIALGAGRLLGWRVALVALVGVGLAYHEAGAPLWSWLSILAATAVLTARPQGRWGTLVRAWWWVSAAVLVFVLVLFARDQVRAALFPQVIPVSEHARSMMSSGGLAGFAEVPQAPSALFSAPVEVPEPADVEEEKVQYAPPPPPPPRQAVARLSEGTVTLATKAPGKVQAGYAFSNLAQDPHSALQTGPAVPRWSWRSVSLSWSGPVRRDQRMRLVLFSPKLNLYLTVIRLALLFFLAIRILSRQVGPLGGAPFKRALAPGAAAIALLAVAAWTLGSAPSLAAGESQAQQGQETATTPPTSFGPSTELLDELRERLTRGAPCQPSCVSTSLLGLSIAGDRLALRAEVHADASGTWAVPGPVASWVPSEIRLDGQAVTALVRLDDGFLHVRLTRGVHRIEASGPLPPEDSLTLQLKDRPHRASAESVGWDVAGIREDGPPDESIQLSRRLRAGQRASATGGLYSSWLEVTRTLELGVSWRVHTTVRRVSPVGAPVAVRIPLLAGEALTEGDWPTEKGEAAVSLSRDQMEAAWASTLEAAQTLTLVAPEGRGWSEVWRVQCGVVWQCRFEGVPPVRHQTEGRYEPEFRPWPGEKLTLRFARPGGVAGATLTIDTATLDLTPGRRLETAALTLATRASREDALTLTLPEGADVQEVKVGGVARPIRPSGTQLSVSVPTGAQAVAVRWQRSRGIGVVYRAPNVALSLPAANVTTTVRLPEGRFVLLARGPAWGPAVLFWSYLVLVILVAVALGRLPRSPLTTGQWLLLGLGLTQTSAVAAALVAGLPFVLAWRSRRPARGWLPFDLIQLGLVVYALVALGCLYSAVETGLLLRPEMQVAGNGSTDTALRWFVDRVEASLPHVSVVSLPVWVYRVLMLAWSLWLAAGLVRGVTWGFRAFTQDGAWRAWRRGEKKAAATH